MLCMRMFYQAAALHPCADLQEREAYKQVKEQMCEWGVPCANAC